jgi:hypothetical protein
MKKIRLDPESLEVLTFATDQAPQSRGTVQGAATGYNCYITVSYDRQTHCLAYPESYWGENTCVVYCPPVRVTDPSVCLQPVDTADLTCLTCPGQPGC